MLYTVFYVRFYPELLLSSGYYEFRKLEILWKHNLDLTVGAHANNLDSIGLKTPR